MNKWLYRYFDCVCQASQLGELVVEVLSRILCVLNLPSQESQDQMATGAGISV